MFALKLYQSTYFKAFLKKEVVFTDGRQLHQMRISYPALVLANMQIVTTAILLVKRKSYFLLDSYTIFMRFAKRYDQKNLFTSLIVKKQCFTEKTKQKKQPPPPKKKLKKIQTSSFVNCNASIIIIIKNPFISEKIFISIRVRLNFSLL